MNKEPPAAKRRKRSDVDGKLRYRCDCGRLIAEDEDWSADDIEGGDRDDLCWGIGANHELDYPEASRVAA